MDSTAEITVSYRRGSKWSVESTDQGEGVVEVLGKGGRGGVGRGQEYGCFCLMEAFKPPQMNSLRDPGI